jgi:fido (protein-threonine AMPylation protein)
VGWTLGDDADDDEEALLAAEGGKAQARVVLLLLRLSRRNAYFLPLQRETICVLHREAMSRLLPDAGELRTRSDLAIENSRHVVPPHAEVPRLIDEACVFVNAQPEEADPLFVAAYILWRICWIHPFDDGNGRTARAVSYLVLSQRLKMELGGEHPLPQRIKFAPIAYVHALEAADAAWLRGTLDVSNLRRLLEFYLEAQLRDDPPGLPPWV